MYGEQLLHKYAYHLGLSRIQPKLKLTSDKIMLSNL